MKNSKMLAAVHICNQINEQIIINNISVKADTSVRPLKGNNQKGITLLALIITIIVLLILSVVSVRLITKSGIIERTKQGTIKHKLEEIHENVKLDYISLKVSGNLNIINMSDSIKKLQENKYKQYIENVSYTSTKVFYKMTDKLDGKEYMLDIQTGEIGTYEDKLQKVEADASLWYHNNIDTITGYKGTDDLLQNVTVPNVLKKDDGTEIKITNVSLSNINFEGTLTFSSGLTINTGTLNNCSTVKNIITGDNVTINKSTFTKCENINNVQLGRNSKILGGIFENSKVKETTVESISEIGTGAFKYLSESLQGNIIINEGITAITNESFYGCTNITSVSIPSTVTSIGGGAFGNCTNLKIAKLPEKLNDIGWRSI